MLQKIYFKIYSKNELYIQQKNLKKSQFPQKKVSSATFSTLIIIIKVYRAANQHIRMISEGSCDTEDWTRCWKFSFDHGNKLHFKVSKNRKQLL